jgi:SAM-dependent methyltransferase
LELKRGSILNLPFEDDSAISVSSLCVVEHVGLGRYGDSLDPYGLEKAIAELKRIVKPGGDLYLSLPLDDENRTFFNAHRAFKEEYILSLFEPFQTLESRYIYSSEFCHQANSGFGIGCYHLRCPQ